MLRVDYQMTTNLSWFGRWNYDKDAQYTPGGFIHEGGLVATRPDQVLAGGIQILGTHLINEERFGWSRFVNDLTGYNAFKNDINTTKLKIPGLNPTDNGAFWGVPQDSITGYSGFGEPTTVYLTHNNIWEGHDTLSWTPESTSLSLVVSMSPFITARQETRLPSAPSHSMGMQLGIRL